MVALISFREGDIGGYDPAVFGLPCRCCGSELWVVTTEGLLCSGECKPRYLLEGEEQLGWFDASEYRRVDRARPRLIESAQECEDRGFRPLFLRARPRRTEEPNE